MANIFHKDAKISALSSIEISNRGTNTIIGAFSVLDDFVKIKHVAGNRDVVIGSKTYINSCTVIYSGNGVIIGDNVLIGPNCSIVPVNHVFERLDIVIREQGYEDKGGILIEDDVWLGANVTVLDGVTIGKGCVIGAGSVVTKSLEPFSVCIGNPAKIVKKRK